MEEKNIIRYKENEELFEKIFDGRLSEFSKYYKHNNKFYESRNINFGKYATYKCFYPAYYIEITDKEKIGKLEEKFSKKEEDDNVKHKNLCKKMLENVVDFEDLLYSKLFEFRKDKKIDVYFNIIEHKTIYDFFTSYDIERNNLRLREYINDPDFFSVYLKYNKLVGFVLGRKGLLSINHKYINVISYDIFMGHLKKIGLAKLGSKIKGEYNSGKSQVMLNNDFLELKYYKTYCVDLEEKNIRLKKTNEDFAEKISQVNEEKRSILLEIGKIEEENHKLKNRFNRFDIMEV